jgi:multidrug efflux pump subunit AcrB
VDRRRALNITADVNKDTTDPAKIRADTALYLEELMAGHPHIQWSFMGEAQAQAEGAQAGKWALIFIMLGIYTMIAIPFQSYAQPLMVMLVIPFGIVGSVLGHLVHGMAVSSMSVCGMLAVTGVVVNDSIIMVDRINRLREDGMSAFDAVVRGAASRFRAIMLTSLTTFVGLMPLMYDFSGFIAAMPPGVSHLLVLIFGDNSAAQATSNQFLTPVSISIGYGCIFATFITLLLVPACYLAIEDLARAWRWVCAKPGTITSITPQHAETAH